MKRLLFTAVLTVASAAWADVLPPNFQGCWSRQAGASCETNNGEAGTCEPFTCSRYDYSQGTPPRVVEYACLTCRASAPPGSAATRAPATAAPGAETMSDRLATMPMSEFRFLVLAVAGGLAVLGGWLERWMKRSK